MDFVGLFERCASFLQSQQRRPGYRPLCDQSGTEQSWANTLNAIWSTWCRLGFPQNVQVDNELVFYGSRQYPRGMGILIRLCLLHDVQPWFIPMAEPWRNGVIEKFNDHYQNGFLQRVVVRGEKDLSQQSLAFEQKHNTRYRYSKLKGQTPHGRL